MVAHLSQWLLKRGLSADDIDADVVGRFTSAWRKSHCSKTTRAVALLVEHLREVGVLAPEVRARVPKSKIDRVLAAFEHYLIQERVLAKATRTTYLPVARDFLSQRFGKGPVRIGDLRAEDVSAFVVRRARVVSPGVAKLTTTGLRSFLRFLFVQGDTATDLAPCVPVVAFWRLASLPKALTPEQVRQLLSRCDRKTVAGRRDFALLLLLVRLGLRASEAASLSLDDLDWKSGEVVVHGKGSRQSRLPIPGDLGRALVSYLRRGRPSCSAREVFVRLKSPYTKLTYTGVSTVVHRAVLRAGIDVPRKGAHLLRHYAERRIMPSPLAPTAGAPGNAGESSLTLSA